LILCGEWLILRTGVNGVVFISELIDLFIEGIFLPRGSYPVVPLVEVRDENMGFARVVLLDILLSLFALGALLVGNIVKVITIHALISI
jgi:hypothetical protein